MGYEFMPRSVPTATGHSSYLAKRGMHREQRFAGTRLVAGIRWKVVSARTETGALLPPPPQAEVPSDPEGAPIKVPSVEVGASAPTTTVPNAQAHPPTVASTTPRRWRRSKALWTGAAVLAVVLLSLIGILIATHHSSGSTAPSKSTPTTSKYVTENKQYLAYVASLDNGDLNHSSSFLVSLGANVCGDLELFNGDLNTVYPYIIKFDTENQVYLGGVDLEEIISAATKYYCPQYYGIVPPPYIAPTTTSPPPTTTSPPPTTTSTTAPNQSASSPYPPAPAALQQVALASFSGWPAYELSVTAKFDPNDPTWALVSIAGAPGYENQVQGGAGIAHLVNGVWTMAEGFGSDIGQGVCTNGQVPVSVADALGFNCS